MKLIAQYDPMLRRQPQAVDVDKIKELGDTFKQMLDFMRSSGGIGLAAPQIGLDMSAFVMEWLGTSRVCINPVVLETSEEMETDEEGCLSFPRLRLSVARPAWAVVGYFDENGEPRKDRLEGFEARIFLHEWDHCQGVCYTDRVGKVSLMRAQAKAAKLTRRMK